MPTLAEGLGQFAYSGRLKHSFLTSHNVLSRFRGLSMHRTAKISKTNAITSALTPPWMAVRVWGLECYGIGGAAGDGPLVDGEDAGLYLVHRGCI